MQEPVFEYFMLLLTNKCNMSCSFCYRKYLFDLVTLSDGVLDDMTEHMALKILNYALDKLKYHEQLRIMFTGGEPLLKLNVIKKVISEFPQLVYHIVSNGTKIDEEVYNYLQTIPKLSFIWSLGDSYEQYGSIINKVKKFPWTTKLVKEKKQGVNFYIENYENMYNDFKYIAENITTNIIVDLPMKNYILTNKEINLFIDNFSKIIEDYYYKVAFGDIINNCLKKHNDKPSCGLDKIMFDAHGDIWQCDGGYRNRKNKFGNIYDGFDYNKLEFLWDIRKNPDDTIMKFCHNCEIYGYCPRHKCMADNYQMTGDIFKPDEAFCIANKTMYKSIIKGMEKIREQKSDTKSK